MTFFFGYLHTGRCSRENNQYSCYYYKPRDRSYEFYCDTASWFSALESCESRCGDKKKSQLAIFEDDSILTEVMNFMKEAYPSKKSKNGTEAKCDVYWVGFAKAIWNTSDDGELKFTSYEM